MSQEYAPFADGQFISGENVTGGGSGPERKIVIQGVDIHLVFAAEPNMDVIKNVRSVLKDAYARRK